MIQNRNVAIQWLRALAASEVMIWHSDLLAKKISTASVHTTVYGAFGGIGVELFFTVSGFLMHLTTVRKASFIDFYFERMRRILPLYWFFTTLVILVFINHPSWHLGDFDLNGLTMLNAYLILPQLGYPILTVGWTLEFEVVFYALVGLFLAFAGTSGNRARLYFGVGLALLGLLGTALPDDLDANPWISHILTRYMFSFAFGWLLGNLGSSERPARFMSLTAFTATFATAVVIGSPLDRYFLFRIAIAAAVFVAGLALRSPLSRLGRIGLAVALIGEASYSIYLSHWFVMSILGKLVGLLSPPAEFDLLIRFAGLSFAVLFGILFFLRIERPLDLSLRRLNIPQFLRETSSRLVSVRQFFWEA